LSYVSIAVSCENSTKKKKKKKRGKKVLSALSEVVLYHFSMIETIGEKS